MIVRDHFALVQDRVRMKGLGFGLKALVINVFTLKRIWAACPYMHINVTGKVKNEALNKIAPQKHH